MIETQWIETPDGATTGGRMAGGTGDVVLFVHGVGSTAAIWDYQLEPLSARYRCAAIELRGNGRAPRQPRPEQITRDGFVQDTLAVADVLGARRFHFVGCSLGGVVGFELWRKAPERIASMTIVGSFAAYPDAQQTARNIIASVSEAPSLEEFARARAERVLPPGSPRARIDETVEQMGIKSLDCYVASTQATWTGDYRADLGGITVPVLVVCGELDPIAPQVLSQEIAGGIPGAQLVVIPGAGHVTNADAPQRFNALLETFLASTESSG